jgi:hypothetical protein
MKKYLLVLCLFISNAAYAASEKSLPFQNKRGFFNKIEGLSPQQSKCRLSYRVDGFLDYPNVTIINTSFTDKIDLLINFVIPAATFEDIFVTGKAFESDYQLPELVAETVTLVNDSYNGKKLVFYKLTNEFNNAVLTSTVLIEMNAKLEPLSFTSSYMTKEKATSKISEKNVTDTCQLNP